MAKKAVGGRPAIFGPKDGGQSYRVLALTKLGTREFEAARRELKRLAKWPRRVSDADVVDFLLRGCRYPGPTKER